VDLYYLVDGPAQLLDYLHSIGVVFDRVPDGYTWTWRRRHRVADHPLHSLGEALRDVVALCADLLRADELGEDQDA